jgi:hypothetical protein
VDRETRMVLNGMMQLNREQQRELITAWNEFLHSSPEQKVAFSNRNKGVLEVVLGPLGGACKCCGRG